MLVRERQPIITEKAMPGGLPDEVMAYCPGCKEFQTLYSVEGKLLESRKFRQYGDRVYHSCGSGQPCRLYRTS